MRACRPIDSKAGLLARQIMSSPSEDDQAIFSAVLDTALGVGAAARIQAGDSVTSKQGEILSVALRTRRTMRKSDERTSDESEDDEETELDEETKLGKELSSKNEKRDLEEAERINKLLPALPILEEFVADQTLLGACAAEMAITKRLRTTAKLIGRAAPLGSDDPGTGLAGEEKATEKANRDAVKTYDKEMTKLRKEMKEQSATRPRRAEADDVTGRRAEAATWLARNGRIALLETEARLLPASPDNSRPP